MMSLFSSFDYSLFPYQLFTFFMLFWLLLPMTYVSSSVSWCLSSFLFSSMKLSEGIKPKNFPKGVMLSLSSLSFLIFSVNLSSILPYTFSLTSQLSVVLLISLLFWGSGILYSYSSNFKGSLGHLVPEGTPIFLVPVIFLIEVVSNLIRPITLTVRLTANILAGHLLMILLSKLTLICSPLTPLYSMLNLVELFVAVIQSYIFFTMACLYFSDVS